MEFKRISDEELEFKLENFQEFLKSKREMPENVDKILLLRYLKFFNGNIEKAFKRLKANMELRNYYTNIYSNRDPQDKQLRRLINQIEMILFPKVTPQNNRVMLIRLIEFDPDQIIIEDAVTVFSIVYDMTLITPETPSLANGEIAIFDLKGITVKHLTKLGFSTLRCYIKYMLEAHPMRIQEVHILNCSSVVDKLMIILRPFLGAKTMKAIHFHAPESNTLFDYVPRDILPVELGGEDGSLDEPKWYWIRRIEDHRDFFLNNDQWKISGKKSTNSSSNNDSDDITFDESYSYMGFC